MDHSSFSTLIWDEKHLKALLRLRQYPARLIQAEPWQTWIEQRGGLERVLDHLRNHPLPPYQEQIRNIILAHPDESARFYYSKLNISPSAYFFRLKDLTRSLLLQLNAWKPEPSMEFSKSTTPINVPAALTPLIGAEKSLAGVVAILRRAGVRLLTLTGPGGVGKTRLAIAAGTSMLEDFPDGVFFVPLETVNDPALLTTQIARSLNMETTAAQSLLEALKAYLRERQMLLILDNFEQMIQGGPMVTDLLQAAGNLKVLVTSREALNVYGEIRFTVPELTRPDPGNLPSPEQFSQWPALDLFVQRVQARHPEFSVNEANLEAIVDICHRLDGLPLAIELAAAQVRLLSPDQALPQLEYGLKALRDTSRDRPSRQRTLWDAIDWSYQLLPQPEKAILRRLAVFGREWSLDAARAVCQMDDLFASLEELADKNLLRYAGSGEDGDARFQMLQPVREYAFDQLDIHAEAEQTQRRHARYFMEMAQSAEPAIGSPGQLRWVRCIKQERENLQLALQWMLDRQEIEMAFTLLGAVWRYYNMLNIWDETKSWMERALAQGPHLTPALPQDTGLTLRAQGRREHSAERTNAAGSASVSWTAVQGESAARVKALWGAAWLATHYNDVARQMLFAEEGLALARKIGDKLLIGLLLQNVADGLRRRKQYDQSMSLLEESLSLFRQMNNQGEVAWVLYHMADTVWDRGEHARSMEIRHESLAIFRAIGDQWSAASTLRQIGTFALEDGDYQLATEAETECLGMFRAIGAKQLINFTLHHLASLAWQRGDFEQVKVLVEESLALSREVGDRRGVGRALNFQGRLALQQSDLAAARELLEKAQTVLQQVGDPAALAENLECLERLAQQQGRV
ncbi:MAG: tetratricopeptide repeat protein [Anaerolineales bacterium]